VANFVLVAQAERRKAATAKIMTNLLGQNDAADKSLFMVFSLISNCYVLQKLNHGKPDGFLTQA